MAGIIPESWADWAFGAEGVLASTAPEADMLPAHDAITINSSSAQHKLGMLVNQQRLAALAGTAAGDGPPAGTGQPNRMVRDQGLRRGSPSEPTRARSHSRHVFGRSLTDSLHVIPRADAVGMGRRRD